MDFQILYFLNSLHTPLFDKLAVFVTNLGSGGIFWILITVLLIMFKRTRYIGMCSAIALILSLLFCNIVLKNLIARPRPCWIDESIPLLVSRPADYSFPSGHTSSSFASAVSIFLHHRIYGIMLIAVAAMISFTRLYLFVHFPSDVLCGALLGILLAYSAKFITEKIYKKYCKN